MILFALGADEVVVGRTQDCLAAIQQYLTVWRIPAPTVMHRLQHWQALPVVGAWPLADRQAITALQPESILTSGSGPFGVHEAQTFGIAAEALCHFDTRTFADLHQQIQQIDLLLGKTAEATHLTAQLALQRDAAQARQRPTLGAADCRPGVLHMPALRCGPGAACGQSSAVHSGRRAPGTRVDPTERRCAALHTAGRHREVGGV
jgi:hypothetical protein